MLDDFFGEYRWYRRLVKGTWYLVKPYADPDILPYWTREPTMFESKVVGLERYD